MAPVQLTTTAQVPYLGLMSVTKVSVLSGTSCSVFETRVRHSRSLPSFCWAAAQIERPLADNKRALEKEGGGVEPWCLG